MEGIGAIFDFFFSLLELLLRAIWCMFSQLIEGPKDGGSRLRPIFLVHALLPLLSLFVFVAAVWLVVGWLVGRNERMRLKTRSVVVAEADRLWANTDEDGRPRLLEADKKAIEDAWGRELFREVDRGLLKDSVTVRSLGSDGKAGTLDDIVAVRSRANQAGVVREEAADRLLNFLQKRVQNEE